MQKSVTKDVLDLGYTLAQCTILLPVTLANIDDAGTGTPFHSIIVLKLSNGKAVVTEKNNKGIIFYYEPNEDFSRAKTIENEWV